MSGGIDAFPNLSRSYVDDSTLLDRLTVQINRGDVLIRPILVMVISYHGSVVASPCTRDLR